MIVDTDVLIWAFRGNTKAAGAINSLNEPILSIVSYMELLQGARNKQEVRAIQAFLMNLGFRTLPLTENIGHRASIYMEEYTLSSGLTLADALLAATAVENREILLSGNDKHFQAIEEMRLQGFRPR